MSGNRKKEDRNIQYIVVGEQRHTPELGIYRAYGIAAIQADQNRRAAYVPDVSADWAFVSRLAERCTDGKLSPIHLRDVVMDALGF